MSIEPAADPPEASSSSTGRERVFRHRNLPLLLLTARDGVLGRFRPILNAHGVTEQQWRIIRALLESGPQEPRQIGERCRISSPSLAGVLARMDDMGLVTRERLPHDQRRVMVSLTDASRRLAQTMAPQIEAVYQMVEDHIGQAVMARFYATLDEVIGLLGEMPPIDGE
ncbi:homoprotocatechuate degradation operon regulator HpaR [Ideonella livida]|uniref:Homoprotocatechuate degradation operon regulator HpaR n=1 Tax=Ideonella livida TaxID=2707176 RepID=A0A7C9TMM7_9BURK|nr:homoprotocatechuate degradation operon regulator HpaR [Ideonella livida]NDY92487.1 homoprotocatechuate degradation operon regulator HpaR [Ideonella livida]